MSVEYLGTKTFDYHIVYWHQIFKYMAEISLFKLQLEIQQSKITTHIIFLINKDSKGVLNFYHCVVGNYFTSFHAKNMSKTWIKND